jgi:Flp pilus assembly protein TadD
MGELAAADRDLQSALLAAPRDARAYVLLGTLRQSQGDWKDAQRQYQRALALRPGDASAANNLAYLLLEHGGDADLALSLAQTARKAMPGLANTADTLGWAYFHKGNYGEAVNLLQDAVRASAEDPTYHYHLGMAYQRNGEPAKARAQFERALQLKPQPSQATQLRKALALTGGAAPNGASTAQATR